MLNWLNTTGGPFIWGELHVLRYWKGIDGSSVEGSRSFSDYNRACDVTGYLGSVRCNAGELIVFGDEAMQTAILEDQNGDTVVARWLYSRSKEVFQTLADPTSREEIGPSLEIQLDTGKTGLFDSSLPIAGRSGKWDTEGLLLDLQPGRYSLNTMIKKSNDFCFLLHVVKRIRDPS